MQMGTVWVVDAAVVELGATSVKQMGAVIKAVSRWRGEGAGGEEARRRGRSGARGDLC